jgi:glycerol-3-phosphate dehydrogenase
LAVYGSDAVEIRALADAEPELARQLHPELPYIVAEVVWTARNEMARTLEDFLARRTRALFLNAAAAIAMAPQVAHILAMELKRDQTWARRQAESFASLAAQYLPTMVAAQKGQR